MAERLSADPVQVFCSPDSIDFTEQVLGVIKELPMTHPSEQQPGEVTRWMESTGCWLVMDQLARHTKPREHWLGAIAKVMSTDLPYVYGPKGAADLPLADNEGLAQHVAFLWDPELRMLWFHRDRKVVGRTHLEDYLRDRSGVTVTCVPVFRDDAIERARKMNKYRSVELAILTRENRRPKRGGLFALFSKLEGYGGARIELKISPTRGGFLGEEVRGLVDELGAEVEEGTKSVQKAKVSGVLSEDEKATLVDLLHDRADFSTKLGKSRRREVDRLMDAVRNVWVANRDAV